MLPFRLETKGIVRIRVAFLGNPSGGAAPPSSLATAKIAVVPALQITAAGLMIDDSPVPALSDWLTVGSALTRTVPGGYAQLQGSALTGTSGNIMPLTLTVTNAAPANAINATWYLVIKCDNELWVTFAVSEADNEPETVVQLPWIHVPTPANVLLPGPFIPQVLTSPAGTVSNVSNFGPGDLVVMATNTTEGDGNDTVSVVATTIGAGTVGSIQLGYTGNDGVSALAVDIGSNDPTLAPDLVDYAHNARISVSAETIGIADTVLVLDASGSMLLRPDGNGLGNPSVADPAARRRWDNLVTAVDHLVFGYASFLTDEDAVTSRMGVAVFPDVLNKGTAGWQTRAGSLSSSTTVSMALPNAIHTALNNAGAAIEGSGMTPMGDGIGVAMGTTMASSGMFAPATEAHRRWMVLMTDGYHNAGTLHPNQFYMPDAVPDFLAKQIRLYTIGYTTAAGGTAVTLLQDLAANALNPAVDSQYAQAAVTNGFEKDLTDTFLDALAVSIGLSPTYDPVGVLNSFSPIAIHEFQVSPYDSGVGIFLDWQVRYAGRIRVALISPRCERFEQEQLEKLGEFEFRALPGYSHAYISRAALAGGGPEGRYGTWKLELRLQSSENYTHEMHMSVDSEPYKFSIFNRSGLRLRGGATKTRWSTSEPIELVVHLNAHGAPVSGARVVANVDAPTADYGSILAGTVVSPAILERATATAQQISPEVLGLWALKAQAIALQDGPIEVSRARREVVFHEAAPGEYRASIPNTNCSGVYTAHVVATGQAGGVAYRRERAVTANVEAYPDPDRTIITYTLADKEHLIVHVRPLDVYGNPVIFDPGTSPRRLGIDARDAKPLTDIVNQFDGTYTRTFGLTGSGSPEVVVTYDGDVVGTPRPLPDPKIFRWMEQVVAYEPGGEKKGDIQDDPKKALGPVKGPEDPHVQIGARGELELTAAHQHFFATHIAVFTHDKSTQPYEVFARVRGNKHYFSLGIGHGPTQVFEVPKHLSPLRTVVVRHRRNHGDPVLVQGVGYTVRRTPCRSK